MENELYLFVDGSVNTGTGVGFGAFLSVQKKELFEGEKSEIRINRFENTSSVKLELENLLWALSEVCSFNGKILVFTDSQNIIGLPGRRARLEKNDFHSKSGRQINNYKLYQQFFQMMDKLNCKFIKIEGHKTTSSKNTIDRLFTLVDRASRKAQREEKYGLT